VASLLGEAEEQPIALRDQDWGASPTQVPGLPLQARQLHLELSRLGGLARQAGFDPPRALEARG